MARITFRAEIGGNCFKVEDRIGTAQAVDSPEIEAYSYSFLHFRGKPDFRYYYIKKGQYYLSERQTRRVCLSGKEAFLSKANA